MQEAAEFSSLLHGASLQSLSSLAFHHFDMTITKTRLFKYIEIFATKNFKFSDK